MVLDHLPEAARVGVGRHALEHDLGAAERERAVGDVGVAGDPADVGGAPEHVVGLQVEGPLGGERRMQQVAAGGVLHALGLAGRARGVEQEQRVLGADPFRLAGGGLGLHFVVQPLVARRVPGDLAAGALVDDHVAHRFAAVQRQRFVDDRLERQALAAAQLLVGGDHHHRAGVGDAVAQALRREAAEHDRVRRADARAGLHRDHAFDRHADVDDDPVALLHAARTHRVGEAAGALEQFAVGDLADLGVVGLEDDRDLVAQAGLDLAVEAVVRGVQRAVVEPLEERRVAVVEHLGEGLLPAQQLTRLARPEGLVVGLGLGTERVVGVHARHVGGLRESGGRGVQVVVGGAHGFVS